MRKYLKDRTPNRSDNPVEILGNILQKLGRTPWLLFGLLIFSTVFFIVHGTITGLTINDNAVNYSYSVQSYQDHIFIGIVSLTGLFILNKYNKRKNIK